MMLVQQKGMEKEPWGAGLGEASGVAVEVVAVVQASRIVEVKPKTRNRNTSQS